MAAAGVLVLLILTTYVKSFINAFKPSTIFQIYSKLFELLGNARNDGYSAFSVAEDLRHIPIDRMEEPQLEKWHTSLQQSVLFNRVCLFVAKKLRDYQRTEWRIIPSIFGILALISFTVISFAGVYYAFFKLDHGLFRYTEEPSWFTFIYFSFNTLVLNSTAEIVPAVPLSQATYMLQMLLSFLLVIILVTLFISHRAQKSTLELDEVISDVESQGRAMEAFIQNEFNIPSIQAAIDRLSDAKAGMVQIIYWLSKEI